MADLSKLVEYDKAYPVTLMRGGKPVGITINIISFDSERVTKAIHAASSRKWMAARENDNGILTPEQVFQYANEEINECVIAAIDSWDFGDHSWGDLPVGFECNEKNKRYFVNHPNAKWIKDTIFAKGSEVSNFFGELPTPSEKK